VLYFGSKKRRSQELGTAPVALCLEGTPFRMLAGDLVWHTWVLYFLLSFQVIAGIVYACLLHIIRGFCLTCVLQVMHNQTFCRFGGVTFTALAIKPKVQGFRSSQGYGFLRVRKIRGGGSKAGALMMEAVRTSETSVNIYLTTRQYIPEDNFVE
jgi:hypothetical protein